MGSIRRIIAFAPRIAPRTGPIEVSRRMIHSATRIPSRTAEPIHPKISARSRRLPPTKISWIAGPLTAAAAATATTA